MGKNIKYGEFTFPSSPARPAKRAVSTAKSTKGIPKAMYDAPHAMKKGGMCKSTEGYAKGGPKMPAKRESEAGVRREAALLSKPKGSETKMERKVGKVMGEFKAGDLHSGSKTGPVVKDRKQAIAIGMSEGRKAQGYEKGGRIMTEGERMRERPNALITEGERARMVRNPENRVPKELRERPNALITEGERARMLKSKNYAKGGSIEAKLEKHADMPASKAHGPGAANKLAKGGVPTHSRVPKFGQMK